MLTDLDTRSGLEELPIVFLYVDEVIISVLPRQDLGIDHSREWAMLH